MTTALIPEGDPRVRQYDARNQETVDRGRIRRLQPVFDSAAHRMAGALSADLRQPVHIKVRDFEQEAWEQYGASIEDPTFLAAASLVGLDGRMALHFPVELVLALVDVQLGGKGDQQPDRSGLTDLEYSLVATLVDDMLAVLPSAFDAFVDIGIGIVQKLRSPLYMKVGRPGETCLLVKLDVSIGERSARTMCLCFPLSVLHPILEAFEREELAEGMEDMQRSTNSRERVLSVPIDIRVGYPPLGLTTTELLELRVGDVIPLHLDKDDHESRLDVVAGGHRVGSGVVVERGKRLACTITNWREERP